MRTFYIHAGHQNVFSHAPTDSALKQALSVQHGIISRRASRLSLIALTGALGMKAVHSELISNATGLYLSSSFSSPSNIHTLMLNLLRTQALRPFNFINSINNAGAFYVAQALTLEGPNVFLASSQSQSSWSKLILLALADLNAGIVDTALIGWCHEHKTHLEVSEQEGSHWFVVSVHPENAIATVTLCDFLADDLDLIKDLPDKNRYYYRDVEVLVNALMRTSMPGGILPFSIQTSLKQKRLLIEPV